jgi:hypothetical protein
MPDSKVTEAMIAMGYEEKPARDLMGDLMVADSCRERFDSYVAAHMPDVGESEADDGKRFPSDLSKSTAIKKTADGFTYLDPAASM